MDQNVGSMTEKMDILKDLKKAGCRFRGDSSIEDVQTLQELRVSGLDRKVPWRLIRDVLQYTKQQEESVTMRNRISDMFSCTESSDVLIGASFRVVPSPTTNVIDLEYTDELKPSFEKRSASKKHPLKYTQVTKEQIVVFCQTMFDSSILFPKTVNFTRDWFIIILTLFSAHNPDILVDPIRRKNANNIIQKMTRKKRATSVTLGVGMPGMVSPEAMDASEAVIPSGIVISPEVLVSGVVVNDMETPVKM
jgi:hypothetical protein